MGAKPWAPAMSRIEFRKRIMEKKMGQHNVHQVELWLAENISDAQLNSNIMEEPYEILPTEPWPRPEIKGDIIWKTE